MPRILLVVTKGEVGGAQQSVFLLARGLKQRGMDVWVASGQGEYLKQKLADAQIPHVYFSTLRRTHNPLAGIRFCFQLRKWAHKQKIDVVHLNSSNTLMAAAFLPKRTRSVFTFRGLSVLDAGYEAGFLLKWLYKIYFRCLLHFVDQSVFVCQWNYDFARQKRILSQGKVIYNAAPESELLFFSREVARKKIEEKIGKNLDEVFLLGSIGRLAYPKNYEFLLNHFDRIVSEVPQAVFVLFGEGPERSLYEKIIAEKHLQDRVYLLGEDPEAKRFLPAFDLFVLPSKYEGLSITVIEALFARISILVSDVGGNKEILPKECIYPVDDISVFSQKLSHIAKQKLVPEVPEQISEEQLIAEHTKLYRALIDSKT